MEGRPLLVVCVALSLSVLATDRPAQACAPAPPEGHTVTIAQEEAVIVWDAARKIEHFIRRGDFETDAPSFGFLVPTPSAPELAAADEGAFARLDRAVAPKTVRRTVWGLGLPLCMSTFLMTRGGAPDVAAQAPVRVLSEQRVAGFDTAVLEADDATALGNWLREHGYPFRPALVLWLERYVAAHWKITAFKIARREDGAGPIGTKPVRLSFAADVPMYPYYEPSDTPPRRGRALRLFVVTGERVQGALGRQQTPWDARVAYARPAPDAARLLAGAVPADQIPDAPWLTAFVDGTARRVADDLFLHPAPDQKELVPPPTVVRREREIPFPLEPLLALAIGLVWWRARKRRKQAAAAAPRMTRPPPPPSADNSG